MADRTTPTQQNRRTKQAGGEDPRALQGGDHVCLRSGCGRVHKRARSGWAKDYCSPECYRLANGLAATTSTAAVKATTTASAGPSSAAPLPVSPGEARVLLGAQLAMWHTEGRQRFTANDLEEFTSSLGRTSSWLHAELERFAEDGRIQAVGGGYRLLTPEGVRRRDRRHGPAASDHGSGSRSAPAGSANASASALPDRADSTGDPPGPEAPPAPSAATASEDTRACPCGKPFKPAASGWKTKYCSYPCMRAANPLGAKAKPARNGAASAAVAQPPSATGAEAEQNRDGVAPADTAEPRSQPKVVVAPAVSNGHALGRELLPAGQASIGMAGYAAGHQDGFRIGVSEAIDLVWTLMRSPTFRRLDTEVAQAIAREALS